jgi:hypothetical protein
MYLVGHAAVGMTLAAGTGNPALAFGIGWLSHYLADFFPHGDEAVGEWVRKGNEVRRLLVVLAPDAALFLAAFAWFSSQRGFSFTAAAAAVGSFVPDVLWGLEKVFKRKLFGRHDAFHGKNHNFFHARIPLAAGIALQAAVAGPLWAWLTLG